MVGDCIFRLNNDYKCVLWFRKLQCIMRRARQCLQSASKAVFTPQLWDRNGSGPQRFRTATGRPCSHLFYCVRSFRNEPTTSRCDRSGTVPEWVRLALWCERATGPVPEPFQLPVTFVDSQPILHSFITSWHLATDRLIGDKKVQILRLIGVHLMIKYAKKCPTALTSDDLDTPRAPVQIMLFVAVLFIPRSPGAPQTFFRHHNFGRANHPMIIISYMMSMCIKLK